VLGAGAGGALAGEDVLGLADLLGLGLGAVLGAGPMVAGGEVLGAVVAAAEARPDAVEADPKAGVVVRTGAARCAV
jgi:hypothetical protein